MASWQWQGPGTLMEYIWYWLCEHEDAAGDTKSKRKRRGGLSTSAVTGSRSGVVMQEKQIKNCFNKSSHCAHSLKKKNYVFIDHPFWIPWISSFSLPHLNFNQCCHMCLGHGVILSILFKFSIQISIVIRRALPWCRKRGVVGVRGRGRLQKFKRHPAAAPAAAAAVTPFNSAKRRIRMLGRLCQGPISVGQKFSCSHAQFHIGCAAPIVRLSPCMLCCFASEV